MREPVAWSLLAASIGVAAVSSVCRPAAAKSTGSLCLPDGYWRMVEESASGAAGALAVAEEARTLVVRVSQIEAETWAFELARDASLTPCRGVVGGDDRCSLRLSCEPGRDEEILSETVLDLRITRSGALSGTRSLRGSRLDASRPAHVRVVGQRISPLQLDRPIGDAPQATLR